VRVHSLTFSYTPGSMKCDSQASLLAHTLANPCLGRKPKARIATQAFFHAFLIKNKCYFIFFSMFSLSREGHNQRAHQALHG